LNTSLPDRPRILVVDDEPDFLTSLAGILTSRGYECLTAGTVREAADLVGSYLPHLCLVNFKLPDGTGLDLIPKIRSSSPGTESIILTGDASPVTAAEAKSLGVFGYVEKPCNIDRLLLTLEKALERQHLMRTAQRFKMAYRELLNAAAGAVFSIAPNTWHLSNVNPAFTELLGFLPEEADRVSMGQLLPDSERKSVMRMLTELSTSRPDETQNLAFEAPLRSKDGTQRWFSIRATRLAHEGKGSEIRDQGSAPDPRLPTSGPQTAPPGSDLLLVCNDTSVSRKALTELEQTKSLLDGVFAALPCGVVIVNTDYQVIDANAAYFKPLGLDRSKVRSRHCHEAFSDYATPCSMFGESCPIARARETGAAGRVVREHRLPDGSIRYIEYTANPLLDGQGSVSGFVVVVNDLTNLHETEAHLEHAKDALDDLNDALSRHHEELEENAGRLELANLELARLGSAKSQFVDAISQELRTPLAAISEGVELVEDGSVGALNDDQQTLLGLAGKNTKRLADLLNDLLDLSKTEEGRLEVHRHRLDLCRVARDVAMTFDGIARDNRLQLKVDLPKGLEPVLADEQSVLRVLNTLVENALKFTPPGGSITIAADREGKGPETRDQGSAPEPRPLNPERRPGIVISVSDTGIGIPGEQQDRLFGKSEPVAPPGAAHPRGNGLGLVLSRRLVEMNGGRIWFEGEEGKGSRFSFTLPVYTEFAGLAADLQYLASVVADLRNGTPVVYCFRVLPRKDVDGVLPRLEELLDSLFPKPITLFVTDSGCGILALAPREVPERELQYIVESLKGASLSVGKQKSNVRLQFGTLDYGQLKLKLQAITAGRSEPSEDGAARWWDALFDEPKTILKEIRR
jgi:PAS domain S-box-containing protein